MTRIPRAPAYPSILALASRFVLEPLFHTRHYSIAAWQRGFIGWSDERRHEWQRDRLAAVVDHAVRTVPAYTGVARPSPSDDIETILARLPVVDKRILREEMPRYRSSVDLPIVMKGTGGTTGDPFHYPLDRDAWSHMYGSQIRFFEETGYRYGEHLAMFGTPASLWNMSAKQRVRHLLERHDFNLTGLTIDPDTSARRVHDALASKAVLWYGYAGTIAAMAHAQLDGAGPTRGPRAIVTTAETLQPQWRRAIEEAFQVEVYDQFGCNDGGLLSQSCGAGRWHVADSLSLVEVLVDGRPAPPGTPGDLVITNLHARALPFLRYHAGDQAVLRTEPCPCGRPGTVIEQIGGRIADQLRFANGRMLSAVGFAALFVETPGIRSWQVLQTGPASVTVRLQAESGVGDWLVQRVNEYVALNVGPDVRVTVTERDPIELTRGGKVRPVIALTTAAAVRDQELTAV